MKSKYFYLVLLFVASLLPHAGFAQEAHWYFGSGLGAQQWHGTLNANVGMGGELVVGRQISQRSALALIAGFASLPFQQSNLDNGVKFLLVTREANLFHGDFLVDLHPFGMGAFSPFARLGGGVLNVQVGSAARKNYVAGVLGGGLRLRLTRDLALNLTGSYHHLAGQALEGFASSKFPDGFMSARLGFTFATGSGGEQNTESWVTTDAPELSPFENAPEQNSAAPSNDELVASAAPDTAATEDEDFLVTETEEDTSATEDTSAYMEVVEPNEMNDAEPPVAEPEPVAEEATTEASTAPAMDTSDPYATFNRKLDMLDQNPTNTDAPAIADSNSVLGDEPKFDDFYPVVKPEAKRNMKSKTSAATRAEDDDVEEKISEPTVTNAAFNERLARLEEQDDFLSPNTKIEDVADAPAPQVERAAPERVESPAPPASTNSVRKSYEAPRPAPTPERNAAAWKTAPAAEPQRELQPEPQRSAPAHESNRPKRKSEQEEQELRELRAILDKLDSGGASTFNPELNSSKALALNSDPEVVELSMRLDEIEREQFGQEKSTAAYEAFKDRLGLEESAEKKPAPVEWNQGQLKSQLHTLNEELAQKEEDITAVRTALAQSGANGAAFPTSKLVTHSSFAQGYESALNDFYVQRYDDAIEKFSRLLEEYPNHTLASNCYYWLGEAQYAFGDFVTALASFNRVLSFQRSLKKDNALLMLGKTYLALQRPIDARAVFNRLLSEYPASDAVVKAQELIKGM